MGFLAGLLGGSSGSSYQAIADPNAVQSLQAQQGVVNGTEQNLQGIINGTGPNPALAQLQAAQNANTQNAAGLVASQKGLNPALAARLAGEQAAQTGQMGANQAAQLTAGQQLGAIGQLGSLGIAQQGANQNNINSANSANAQIANTNAGGQQSIIGGAIGGIGTGLTALAKLAHGGMVPHYAEGGAVAIPGAIQAAPIGTPIVQTPISAAGRYFNNATFANPLAQGMNQLGGGIGALIGRDRSAPQTTAPQILAQEPVAVTAGGPMDNPQMPMAAPMAPMAAPDTMYSADGGQVPGEAEVKGDSLKNDKVPAVLSPGEIVIPRSILQGKNPGQMAAQFVEQELAKHAQKKSNFASGGAVVDEEDDTPTNTGGGSAISSDPGTPAVQPAVVAPQVAPVLSGATGSWAAPAPVAAPAIATPAGMSQSTIGQIEKGFGEQRAGLQSGAAAEQALAKEKGKVYDALIPQLAAQTAKEQQQNVDYDKENQGFVEDVKNGHINPNQYLANMSTGSKISTAIGLILGGIGGGLTHQANPALGFIQNQIDNDIKGQQAELGKKQNLLAANMQKFGNMQKAQAVTRANLLTLAATNLDAAGAKAAGPLAASRAQQASGALRNQAAQELAPYKIQQMRMQQAAGSNDPSQLVPALVPQSEQAKVFTEIQQAQNVAQNKGTLMKLWDQANQEQSITNPKTFGGITNGPAMKALQLATDPYIHDELGRINPIVKGDLNGTLPGALTGDKSEGTKRQAFEKFLDGKASAPNAKAYGIDLSKYQSTNPQNLKNTYKPGDVVSVKGQNYQVGPDGNKLIAVH